MTSEDMYADMLKETKERRVFFDAVRPSLPPLVQKLGDRFRELLMLGGRIPVPIVVIDEDKPEGYAYTTAVCAIGEGVLYQLLVLGVQGTQRSLEDWCQRAEFSEEESVIRLAAHEARHCLQMRKEITTWRGVQWWKRWLQQNFRGTFKHIGTVVYSPEAIRTHVIELLGPRASRKQRNVQAMQEHDAEVTAIACAASWRMTPDVYTTVRLLHG